MKKKIIMVTGGQRSGKSEFAEELAMRLGEKPVYMATARVMDKEFEARVERHRSRRGPQWTTIEEPLLLSRHNLTGRVVLIDCVTLWATNTFFDAGEDADAAMNRLAAEFEEFTSRAATYIFVTNEIGLGGVSENPLTRRFTDLQGNINRLIASRADEVYLVVSGIPVKIKSQFNNENL